MKEEEAVEAAGQGYAEKVLGLAPPYTEEQVRSAASAALGHAPDNESFRAQNIRASEEFLLKLLKAQTTGTGGAVQGVPSVQAVPGVRRDRKAGKRRAPKANPSAEKPKLAKATQPDTKTQAPEEDATLQERMAQRIVAQSGGEKGRVAGPPRPEAGGPTLNEHEDKGDDRSEMSVEGTAQWFADFMAEKNVYVSGDGTFYVGGPPPEEGIPETWDFQAVMDEMILHNETEEKQVSPKFLAARLRRWRTTEMHERAKEIVAKAMRTVIKSEAVRLHKGLKEIIRRRFSPDEDQELAYWTLLEMIYQTKRNMLGLKVYNHLALLLFGKGGGGGKSEFMRAFLSHLGGLYRQMQIGEIVNPKNRDIWKAHAVFVDELDPDKDRKHLGSMKNLITADVSYNRTLYSHEAMAVFHRVTFFMNSNFTLAELGWADGSGARRIAILLFRDVHSYKDWPTDEEKALVDTYDFAGLWATVDPRGISPLFSKPEIAQRMVQRQHEWDASNPVEAWFKAHPVDHPIFQGRFDAKGFITGDALYALYAKDMRHRAERRSQYDKDLGELKGKPWFSLKKHRLGGGGALGWMIKTDMRPGGVSADVSSKDVSDD